ncbi:PQQ-binding-like beta-propeller repeat protein [Haloferax sp. Atlit-47N]|uniref:PQQ-binding-like beta-propeller repeat protein n=1 Tax=Haloferax sp. Atlit-47N TaxID=2077199 RepID=UPI001F3B53EC|nr:PQQ-binding-like beta-propeller repeat protein [Haloferax sp. Atlit-47N]
MYFGGYDGYVYELHARTGKLMWSFDTGTEITGSPAVVNRRLYIGSRLGGMYVFG